MKMIDRVFPYKSQSSGSILHVNRRLTASRAMSRACLPPVQLSSQQLQSQASQPVRIIIPLQIQMHGLGTTAAAASPPPDANNIQPAAHTTIAHPHLPQIPPPSSRPHVILLHRTPSPTDRAPRPLNIPIPPRNKASPSPHHHQLRHSSHRRHRAILTHDHILLPTRWRRLPR